ncbi:hypothetical protein OEZ86_008339 [Tetradesmus obliquus]|nr:hypothetical protein OEZ86_008339 [Tetradesmus obliquus]
MRVRAAGLGGLLLSVLLVQALALPWPYNNVPSIDSLEGDMCNIYGEAALPFAANNFCNGTGFTTPGLLGYRCDVLALAEHTFQSFSKPNATCPAAKQTRAANVSLNGTAIPWPLSDQRPLPANLPASLLAAEGPSMYWHWKNLYNFELWAPCAATNASKTQTSGWVRMGNSSLEWLRPVGWRVLSTLWVKDGPAQAGVTWPFATVLLKGKQLVILIRGTETYADWLTDFTYNENKTGTLSFPGATHQGFTALANTLWSIGLRAALFTNVVEGSVTSVSVAGHSLGAGVSQLVAYAAQDYLRHRSRSANVKVDAYLFAPPNAGDATWAAGFNKLVNARRFPFIYDIIPQVPCTPTMAACKNTVVPNPNPNGTWPYTTVGGTLQLLPAGMPSQAAQWGMLSKMYPCQLERFVLATHICSYNCYFSQYVSDTNNTCLLWNTTTTSAGGVGTYCSQYPVTSGPQYPFTP